MTARTRTVLVAVALATLCTFSLGTTVEDVPGAVGCGGVQLPKGAGGFWTCTFDDEFDGSSIDTSKWTVVLTSVTGYHSGNECYLDNPANVSVSNGILSLTARQMDAPFTCSSPMGNYQTPYTSGSVMTLHTFTQTYGRFDVRAAFPGATVPGLQTTLWLYPVNATRYGVWPASGEIDFAEQYSKHPDRVIPYIHYNAASYDPNVTNNWCLIDAAAFHDYVVEWTPDTITISFDGKTCLSESWNPAAPLVKPQPFDQPFFLSLTQALGIKTNAFDPATTPLPATTQIDYVRVWS